MPTASQELRRAPTQVVVDVVIAKQHKINEAPHQRERRQARQDAHDHVHCQAQDIQRMRRPEAQGASSIEREALQRSKADGHQARAFQGGDGSNQRCPEDQRRDSGRRREEEQRDVDVRDDAIGRSHPQPVQQQARRRHQDCKSEQFVSKVGDREAPPCAAKIGYGARQKRADGVPHRSAPGRP